MNNIYRGDIYYIANAKYIDEVVENSPARPAIIVSNNKCNTACKSPPRKVRGAKQLQQLPEIALLPF